MNENPQNEMYYQEQEVSQERVGAYLAKVMGWMCVGLLTTAVSALFCAITGIIFIGGGSMIYILPVVQILLVVALSAGMNKLSPALATVLFMLYAAFTGATISVFFFVFEAFSLISVFGLTACVFFTMAVFGAVTKKDLTGIGSLCIFGLFGLIISGIFNLFFASTMLDFVICFIGILIFIGLTAYDTQRIKSHYIRAVEAGQDEEGEVLGKLAIYGALTLYLDFINLFLKLLRIMGRRK